MTTKKPDKYDKAIAWMLKRWDKMSDEGRAIRWATPRGCRRTAGCLFRWCTKKNNGWESDVGLRSYGCPSQVAWNGSHAQDPTLEIKIRALRHLLPNMPDENMSKAHLQGFARVQRMVDKALGRR
jgi:hypothetical protein